MKNTTQIQKLLWNASLKLRGSMDASRYKDYMLGLMFYKFLCDKNLDTFKIIAGLSNVTEKELLEKYISDSKTMGQSLYEKIRQQIGYFIEPNYLFQKWIEDIRIGDFALQNVEDGFCFFEKNVVDDNLRDIFTNSPIDLTSPALGHNLAQRSRNISDLVFLFDELQLNTITDIDLFGDAYEYLIGQFAMESGKKAGEFYTPRQVSEVMAQIIAQNSDISSIYDPTVGSGSLLLTVRKHLNKESQRNLSYYGQEKNTVTYNLARMNLLLHGVNPGKINIRNADTLADNWPDSNTKIDAIVMNPPYSLNGWNKAGLKTTDPRFEIAGVLPPNSKGDFAFLLHGFFHLSETGTMAIVLPHGVLFRGASEGAIRQKLIELNHIDAIIGLPSGLFTNTDIPVAVMILKKNRPIDAPILMVDASRSFLKGKTQNFLQEKDIAKIVDIYTTRNELKGYSHLATREQIIENEYNLNIARYIDFDDNEIPHDVDAHMLGGIPKRNIDALLTLNATVPEIMSSSFEVVRPKYVKLNKTVEQLKEEIFNSPEIIAKKEEIQELAKYFIEKYRSSDSSEGLLCELKEKLGSIALIDIYSAFQIVVEAINSQEPAENYITKFVNLIEKPLKDEVAIISMLEKRYEKTLSDIDRELEEAEKEFQKLISELQVRG